MDQPLGAFQPLVVSISSYKQIILTNRFSLLWELGRTIFLVLQSLTDKQNLWIFMKHVDIKLIVVVSVKAISQSIARLKERQ